MSGKKILVIEDETPLRERMVRMLNYAGFMAEGAADGEKGLEIALRQPPDAILCDILMPVMDGNMVAPILRANPATQKIPLIMITALSDRETYRRFMELGADDFLVKPFASEELFGAIRAQIKKYETLRSGEEAASPSAPETIQAPAALSTFGDWSYDPEARRLSHNSGKQVWLTGAEGQVLKVLIDNKGKAVAREMIHAAMKEADFSPFDRSVDILIARLRRKLDDNPRSPVLIRTIRSTGYMLDC
ncbi:MAG TPA: response regulator transcription factor [Alphaproteobacteria bacterium]|nr:response regulator transcription factor [Alphaproteobacteria bacterium]